MPTLATKVERQAGRRLTPAEIFEITAAREIQLSRLLMYRKNKNLFRNRSKPLGCP